jgi:hypothetical protein
MADLQTGHPPIRIIPVEFDAELMAFASQVLQEKDERSVEIPDKIFFR